MRVGCIILAATATLLASCDATSAVMASKVSTLVSSGADNAVLNDSPAQRSLRTADKTAERMLALNIDSDFTIAVLDKMVNDHFFERSQFHRWFSFYLTAKQVEVRLQQAKPREPFAYKVLYTEYATFLHDDPK